MQGNKKRDNINKNIPLIMIVFIVFIIIIQYMLHFGSLFSIKIDQSVDGINIFPVIISLHNTYINITEIYASNFILFITFIHSHKMVMMAMRSDRKKDDDNQNDKATKK